MAEMLHDPTTWVAVAFVLFAIGFIKLALPHIVRGLDARATSISTELDEAVRLREEAQAVLADYQQRQRDMVAEAEAILKRAQVEADNIRKNAETEMQAAIERRTRLAQEKIARSESDAIAKVKADLVEVAATAAKTVMVDMMNSQADTLIDAATKDLERIIH